MAEKRWLGDDAGNEGDLNIAANWLPSGVPASGDNVTFPVGAPSITDSLDALNAATLSGALGIVLFEEGFDGEVGSETENMQFSCTRFEFAGIGIAYIDLEASAIPATIHKTASASAGYHGLYLIGSALTLLHVLGGNVGVATRSGETATVGTIRIVEPSAEAKAGSSVTLTGWYQFEGTGYIHCALTGVTTYGGTLYTFGVGAITTIDARGGTIYPESIGTIGTLNADEGTVDFTTSSAPRTVTTFKQNPGSVVAYLPAVVTMTNRSAPDFPIRLIADKP